MTFVHRFLTSSLLVLLAGCPASSVEEAGPSAPLTELPPPIHGTRDVVIPPPVDVDPSDWRLPDPDRMPPHAPWLRLVFAAENRAEMEACGCPGAPTGGLARRVTYAAAIRALLPDALVVEGPNALSRLTLGIESVRGEDRARGRKVLELLRQSKPDAFFPGQADLAVVPVPELQELAGDLPIVATNLLDPPPGLLDHLLVERGGRRILLLGLIRPPVSQGAREAVPLQDAAAAAARVKGEVEAQRGPVDLVVAFTDGSLRDVNRLLAEQPPVDVLITPPVPGDSRPSFWSDGRLVVRARPAGRTYQRLDLLLTAPTGARLERGGPAAEALERAAGLEERYLRERVLLERLDAAVARGEDPRRRARGALGEETVDPRTVPEEVRAGLARLKASWVRQIEAMAAARALGHAVAISRLSIRSDLEEDPAVARSLDEYSAGHLAAIVSQLASGPPAPAAAEYGGMDSCLAGCHDRFLGHWATTPHSEAWATLVERGEDRNPECLACHTTGFAQPGGFADPAQETGLLNVQCEACHGPMQLHVLQAGALGAKPSRGVPVDEATCRRCHDPTNSPAFDYATYLPRVRHPGLEAP